MSRGLSLIPIVLGAAAGAVVAILQAPRPNTAPPAGTVAPATLTTPASAVARAETPIAQVAQPDPRQPSASSAPVSASVAPAKPSPVFDLSEPKSAAELLETQIACNRSQPEACERAARALESGTSGTKDPARARSLKRIALTLYVKQCEGSRPAACARLAEMYETGETVQKNEKSVQGLRVRVTELCRTRPTELGCAAAP
jgi:hypothetical protein